MKTKRWHVQTHLRAGQTFPACEMTDSQCVLAELHEGQPGWKLHPEWGAVSGQECYAGLAKINENIGTPGLFYLCAKA